MSNACLASEKLQFIIDTLPDEELLAQLAEEAAELSHAEELRHIIYVLPTSWAHFKGTKECPKYPRPPKGD